jgi:hypothetical protein
MSQVAVLLLLILAGVCFVLSAFSVTIGKSPFAPGWFGLLLLTFALWLGPALFAL